MVLFGKQSTKRMIKRHSQFPVKQRYMYVCLYFADISLTLKQNIKTVVIVISVESMRRCKWHCCDKSLKYLKMRCRVFKFLGGLACDFLPKKNIVLFATYNHSVDVSPSRRLQKFLFIFLPLVRARHPSFHSQNNSFIVIFP